MCAGIWRTVSSTLPRISPREEPDQVRLAQHVGGRVVVFRFDALPQHHLHPGIFRRTVRRARGTRCRFRGTARRGGATCPGSSSRPRLLDHLTLETAKELLARFVVTRVAAGIRDAVGDPVLQRYAPLPTRLARNRTRVGNRIAHLGGLYGQGIVVEQPGDQSVKPTPRVLVISNTQVALTGLVDGREHAACG